VASRVDNRSASPGGLAAVGYGGWRGFPRASRWARVVGRRGYEVTWRGGREIGGRSSLRDPTCTDWQDGGALLGLAPGSIEAGLPKRQTSTAACLTADEILGLGTQAVSRHRIALGHGLLYSALEIPWAGIEGPGVFQRPTTSLTGTDRRAGSSSTTSLPKY